MKERNANIDLIKLCACVGVVFIHTILTNADPYGSYHGFLLTACYNAVPFFMMVTGYYLFSKRELSAGYTIRKILGILRFSLIWAVIFLIIGMLLPGGFSIDPVLAFPSRFVLALYGIRIYDLYLILWYMGTLILIYLFAYFYYKFGFNRLCVFFTTASIGIILQILSYIYGESLTYSISLTIHLWTWLSYSMLGAMMPEIIGFFEHHLRLYIHVILFILSAALWICFVRIIGEKAFNDLYPENFYDSLCALVYTGLGFSLLMRIRLSDRIKKIVLFLAPATAGIYPLHMVFVSLAAASQSYGAALDPVLTVLAVLAVSFAVILPISKTRIGRYLTRI